MCQISVGHLPDIGRTFAGLLGVRIQWTVVRYNFFSEFAASQGERVNICQHVVKGLG